MKQTSIILFFLIGVLSTTFLYAGEAEACQVSGTMKMQDGNPVADGTVLFFSEKAGPPPSVNKYMRTPENIAGTDSAGNYLVELPVGKYYIGVMKYMTEKWGGPPREGDLFFISRDETGGPKIYVIEVNSHIDIEPVPETAVYEKMTAEKDITAIEGTVHDEYGNPVKDAVVFAHWTPAMDGLAFVSGYTEEDGRYLIRVHKGGKYYLMAMGKFGSALPMSGMTLSADGKQVPAGINVNSGEMNREVDIIIEVSP